MKYNINYELIGRRIKNQRLKMKFTQEVLSEKVDIGVQHMSNIENGKSKLSLSCLVSIANALETTADHLLMDNVKAAGIPNLLAEAKTLLDGCTPEEIFIIIETAKTMIKSIRLKNLRNIEE